MEKIDFSKISTYIDLQAQVFSMKTEYSELEKYYDFELAYQNRYNSTFDWQQIDYNYKIEVKMADTSHNMDLGEALNLGPSDRGKRPRTEFSPVPPSDTEIPPGRPYRPGTNYDNNYYEDKNYKYKGKVEPIERINLIPAHRNGTILTINLNNPQIWESVISAWEFDTIRAWANCDKNGIGDMIAFLETLLGETAANIFNEAKVKKAGEIEKLRQLGDNPYNFTKFIRTLILGFDPSRQNTNIQDQAYRNLEQLNLGDWSQIDNFCKLYVSYASRAGKYFDNEIANRFLIKLPGELGREINEKWKNTYPDPNQTKDIGVGPRIFFTFQILQEKCREYKIQKQVKKQSYKFCKNIYTSQDFPEKLHKKKKILRKSKRSFYKKDRNVKKPTTRKCNCYICGSPDHFASNCNKRSYNKNRSLLIQGLEDDVVSISSNESKDTIYSITDDEYYSDSVTSDYAMDGLIKAVDRWNHFEND